MPRPPKEVLHDWQKKPSPHRPNGFIHECAACEQWTANLPLYRYEVCGAKDRRKGEDRRGR